jgi:hypothetical protein
MVLHLERWAAGRPDPRPALAALVTAQAPALDGAGRARTPQPTSTVLRRETSATVVELPPPVSSQRAALDTTELELAPPVWTSAAPAAQPSGGGFWQRWLTALATTCALAVLVSSFETRTTTARLTPSPGPRPGSAVLIVPLPAPAVLTRATAPAAEQAPPPTPGRPVRSLRRSAGRTSRLATEHRTPRPSKRAARGGAQRGHRAR